MDDKTISAGKMTFTTADGRAWTMRQPTPDEAGDGDSAYRLTYNRIVKDSRLADLAGALDGRVDARGE